MIDARTELTSAELAKILRTTPEHAETLLAYLLATGKALSPITDDGDVRYRSAKAPIRVAEFTDEPAAPSPAKTRNEPRAEPSPAPDPNEAARDALAAEELAEEEAAAEAAKKESKLT